MRSNLLSLQHISKQVSVTQNKLSTGKKVTSAIDNPSSYYTAVSLTNRADDLNALLDAMGQAISTVNGAITALKSAISFLEQGHAEAGKILMGMELTDTRQDPDTPVDPDPDTPVDPDPDTPIDPDPDTPIDPDPDTPIDPDPDTPVDPDPDTPVDPDPDTPVDPDPDTPVDPDPDIPVDPDPDIPVDPEPDIPEDPMQDYIDAGYTILSSTSTMEDIQNAIQTNAKIVLSSNIVLTSPITINKSNVLLDGNGYTISFNSSSVNENMINITSGGNNTTITNLQIDYNNSAGGAAIYIDSVNAEANITSTQINADGNKVYGIQVVNGGVANIDTLDNITVSGKRSQKTSTELSGSYDGESNTTAMVSQLQENALAATAANQFYVVSSGDSNFGAGTWYLPSIGELAQMYGTDMSAITTANGNEGADGGNISKINNALNILSTQKGVEAEEVGSNNFYLSSSEWASEYVWALYTQDGGRYGYGKDSKNYSVRAFQSLENCFDSSDTAQVGYVMYSDMSYGAASEYDGSRQAVGIIAHISDDGTSAKIISLKDLTFDANGGFNASAPYSGSTKYTYLTTSTHSDIDITGIPNYADNELLVGLQSGGTLNITGTPDVAAFSLRSAPVANGGAIDEGPQEIDYSASFSQFKNIIDQYNHLIKDSSYKGINLLKGDDLVVKFSSNSSSTLVIHGEDMSSVERGISMIMWQSVADIENTIKELQTAISQIRQYNAVLGNEFDIISNRKQFTENIINVLSEGSDKLTLADMNEESAYMLSLLTRQKLAINSLSLAAQATQSILKVF